jgi:alpha-mannosidase
MQAIRLHHGAAAEPKHAASLFSVTPASVRIETVKQADDRDGVILRLVEWAGKPTQVRLSCGFPIQRAFRADLLEANEAALIPTDDSTLTIAMPPHAIETIRLIPRNAEDTARPRDTAD